MNRSGKLRSAGPFFSLLLATVGAVLTYAYAPAAQAQKAAYVVQSKSDVDGDGRADEVRIDDLGTISVSIAGRADAGAWTALAASGKVVGGSLQIERGLDPRGRTIVVATSKLRIRRGRTHEEAVVLAWEPGKLSTLWRGSVGGTGQDGAQYISLKVGKFGLIKYASRHGVYRCDGETAHLDAQRYDFASGTFRRVRQAVRVDRSNAILVLRGKAKPEDAKLTGILGFWFRAQGSSSALQAASAAELVPPTAISDRDESTAWVERKGGFGRGEFVTLKSSVGPVQVTALRLVLGHGGAITNFNRPRRLALLLGKSHKYWIEFDKDPRSPQWVHLPEPVSSACVTLIIDDVYPHSASKANKGQTAITEISVLAEEDMNPALAGELLTRSIAEGRGGADLSRLLKAWGANAETPLLAAIANTKEERTLLRLRLALARIPANAEQIVAGLANESLRPRDLARLRDGLAALGSEAISPLADALSHERGSRGTEQVAGLLAGMKEAEAGQALLRAAGKGDRRKRSTVLRALGKRAGVGTQIIEALAAAKRTPRRADLYRALGFAGAALPADSPERAALAGQLAAALASTGTDPGVPYEIQYRVLQAASMVGGSDVVSALTDQVRAREGAGDAEGLALLRLAVSALAGAAKLPQSDAPPADVVAVLQAALEHKDPGVRLAALSHTEAPTAPLSLLANRLHEDAWPEVRRAVAASLSLHCRQDASAAALVQATRHDTDVQVARTALSALIRCQFPGLFSLLLEMLDDNKRPMEVRLYAARKVGAASAGASAPQVLQRFRKARGLALTERKNGKLASALTVALTDLASDEAVAQLEDSASDPAVPELQAAAVTALAKLCRPTSKSIIRDLKRSSSRNVAMAARQAAHRCH